MKTLIEQFVTQVLSSTENFTLTDGIHNITCTQFKRGQAIFVYINFGLEDNRKRGIGIGTFADLLQIFFSSCNGPVNDVLREDDHIVYDSDFDASYSWESVMTEIFDCIAPFLEDESSLGIYPDNEKIQLVVKNGIVLEV